MPLLTTSPADVLNFPVFVSADMQQAAELPHLVQGNEINPDSTCSPGQRAGVADAAAQTDLAPAVDEHAQPSHSARRQTDAHADTHAQEANAPSSPGRQHSVEAEAVALDGFATAAGMPVLVSKQAMAAAQALLQRSSPPPEGTGPAAGSPARTGARPPDQPAAGVPTAFTTAGGKQVLVSKQGMARSEALLQRSPSSSPAQGPSCPPMPAAAAAASAGLFATASGQPVVISEAARARATALLAGAEQPEQPELAAAVADAGSMRSSLHQQGSPAADAQQLAGAHIGFARADGAPVTLDMASVKRARTLFADSPAQAAAARPDIVSAAGQRPQSAAGLHAQLAARRLSSLNPGREGSPQLAHMPGKQQPAGLQNLSA